MPRAALEAGDALVTDALLAAGIAPEPAPRAGLVFGALHEPDGWTACEDRLVAAFRLTQAAVAGGAPVVYLVRAEDLRGARSAVAAAAATALLSAARAVAMEGARSDQSANVVAFDADGDLADVAATVAWLLDGAPLRGQLLDLGRGHFGRAHP